MMRKKEINNYIIRKADKSDALNISILYKKVWSEYKNKFPTELLNARQPNVKQMENWIENETYYVFEKNNSIIGVVGCFMKYGNCKLIHMAVSKDYRNRGVGYQLLKKVEEFGHINKAMKVWFDTSTRLKEAIEFYKKYDYQQVGELKKHFWGEDIILFEKLFV